MTSSFPQLVLWAAAAAALAAVGRLAVLLLIDHEADEIHPRGRRVDDGRASARDYTGSYREPPSWEL